MTEITPLTVAEEYIKTSVAKGQTLETLVGSYWGIGYPAVSENSHSVNIGANDGYVFTAWPEGEGIKVKKGQIAVSLDWNDGRYEYGVFSISALINGLTEPKQLRLFGEEV
jgi:hypothetical protein